MLSTWDLLAGALLPAVVSTVVCIAVYRWSPSQRERESQSKSQSHGPKAAASWLTLGSGCAAAYFCLFGRPEFPPIDVTEWLPWFCLGLVAIGSVLAVLRGPAWLQSAMALPLIAGAILLLVRPKFAFDWTIGQGLVRVAALTLAGVCLFGLLSWRARRTSPALCCASLLLVSSASALVLLMSGSQKLGQVGGMLAAATAGSLLGLMLARRTSGAAFAPLPWVLLQGSLLLCGYFYAELSWQHASLLCLAALAPLLQRLPGLSKLSVKRAIAVQLLLTAAVAAIPVTLAGIDFIHSMSRAEADYEGY